MVKRDEEESVGQRGRVKRMERTVSEEGGKRKEEAQGAGLVSIRRQ